MLISVRHWSSSNGSCKLTPECAGKLEDISHILQFCPGLAQKRHDLMHFTFLNSSFLPEPIRQYLLLRCDPDSSDFCDFILDCSNDATVVRFVQEMGPDLLNNFFGVT